MLRDAYVTTIKDRWGNIYLASVTSREYARNKSANKMNDPKVEWE